MHEQFRIVVIGASSGGLDAIRDLVSRLPKNLNAAVFIVWHMSPTLQGVLPDVLNRFENLYASHGYDKEPIVTGRIYIAPPDHHMLVERGRIRITKGPKENRFRPAVDPLFRSAAYIYGTRVIGIILSGALDDGTAGLWTVKHFGGITMVQDPFEAEVRSMPDSALREVQVDHCLPVSDMVDTLIDLTQHEQTGELQPLSDERLQAEIQIAKEESAFEKGIMEYGELSPFTCPECHGVLKSLFDGHIERFRCHTGHAFSADSLLNAITENIEEALYSALRGVDESVMLLNHMGDHFAEENKTHIAAAFFQKANEARERASVMRQAVLKHEQLSRGQILKQIEAAEKNRE